MGSCGVVVGFIIFGIFIMGCWVVLVGVAATDAHVGHELAAIGVAFMFGSHIWGCGVCVLFDSSSLSFLVRYTLVSARYAIVGSAGFLLSPSSASSMMDLSQSLKNPIFSQDGIFFLVKAEVVQAHRLFHHPERPPVVAMPPGRKIGPHAQQEWPAGAADETFGKGGHGRQESGIRGRR